MSSKVLLDVFMGILGRVVQMHVVRRDPEPLIHQFDALFKIMWGALKAPEST